MKKRIKQSGGSIYNEQIQDAREILLYDFFDDISYNPNIVRYQTKQSIPIKMYEQKSSAAYGFITKFLSPCNDPIELGELLYDTIKKEYWLCVESYQVSGVHIEGKLGKCSRFIKWQEPDGSIQEIPVISRNATQYNNGETSNHTVTLASDQLMLYTQMNSHTKILEHGMKFFIDENDENPSVYELTKPDTVDYSYLGKGMMSLMMTECPYTPTIEEVENGVCGFRKSDDSNISPSFSTANLITTIIGSSKIKIGIPRTYTVIFMDKEGKTIDWDGFDFKWNILSNHKINHTIHENKIDLLVNDEDYIDNSILLQIITQEQVLAETSITITTTA